MMRKAEKFLSTLTTHMRYTIVENTLNAINELLDHGKNGFLGFGHGQIKSSAELAAQKYGCEWAERYPSTKEAIQLREKLRIIVISQTPSTHSNRDMVWQRFRLYALKHYGN
jgi:hypothetical protein